ncbi:MarR family winged helix-turn-helix transcriptional regulator [Alloacidobacterium sp.]|uniref:MarR family winged helix-turn-helix transcriptional regulator n=1 Tax=Alloacidobacterium sp. TaxID=2951999 RepID=UPI002D3DB335|nr:MarR family transcriptional regulator [Alloacidobacterium sp.]HYK36217.1 MarR family transcriptional regulator [Alloacidobacterium sp.]
MNESRLPSLPCLCASFRRAARALTQRYDAAIRPLGLRVTQFTILQALSLTGEVSQGKLGEILALDSTTLTRTLDHMRRAGWISRRRGEDRREWRLRLSASGRNQLDRALPTWKEAQLHMAGRLGDKLWQDAFHLTGKVADLAVASGDLS